MKRETTKVDLGSGSVGKLLFRMSLPTIVAQLINVLYNMVDRMYIGHIDQIGPDALTGVGVTMPVIMCISAFAALASMGGSPRAAIMMGKGEPEQAEKILGNCTAGLLCVSVALTTVFLVFGRDILLAFGASEKTIVYAWDYMKIYAMGTIFVQFTLGLNAFINTQGFTTFGMLTVMIGAICNIILDPIFIFVFGMGVRGAALATIISQGISAVWVLRFLISDKSKLRIRRANLRIEPKVYLPCVALGAAPFVMQFTESVLSVCLNTSLLKYGGDVAVGAMTILASSMQFAMLPLQGLTQGAQPIISYNYGAKRLDRVSEAFRFLLLSCLAFSTTLWAICRFCPQVFIGIFTNDATLAAFTQQAMRVYMAAALVFGAQIACQQTFVALGKAGISLFLACLRKVILLIPMIYILPNFFEDKVFAVFLAEPLSDCLAVATTCTMFFFTFRKLKRGYESSEVKA